MDREGTADNEEALALLQGILARDSQALTALHGLLARRIFSFALRMVRDNDLANQVVIDTLHDVWKHPERFNGQSKVSTWILAIAKYKALHAMRKQPTNQVDIQDLADTLVSERGNPEASSLVMERHRALWSCIEQLPEAQRECLHLVFYEGMALGEVAQIQSVPENTVKTRVFHARRKLQACMGEILD